MKSPTFILGVMHKSAKHERKQKKKSPPKSPLMIVSVAIY